MSKRMLVVVVAVWAGMASLADADERTERLPSPRPVAPGVTSPAEHAPSDAVASEPCGRCCREKLGRLRDWLCFREERAVKCCHPAPCCRPPLYAFFLHRCCQPADEGPAVVISFSYTDLLHDNVPLPCRGCDHCDHCCK
jgi:hypothetical protein